MQTDYLHPSFPGIWEERVNAGETIYSPPGSDVNLTCQTTKEKEFLVQAQWSKVNDKNDLLVVYHPQYGFHCPQRHACEAQVASIKIRSNVTEWTLSLRNISTTFNGKYECSFTVYPEGIQTTVYNLVVAPREYITYARRDASCFHVAFPHLVNTQRQQPCSRFGDERAEPQQKGVLSDKGSRNRLQNATSKCDVATVAMITNEKDRRCERA